MSRIVTFISLAIISVALLTNCGRTQTVHGNNQITTTSRTASAFTTIELKGAYRLNFEQADTQSVSITTDSNIEPYILTTVSDGELNIFSKRGYNLNSKTLPLITVKGPRLTGIILEGSGELNVNKLQQTVFQLVIRGAGNAQLQGQVSDFSIDSSGATKVDAHALKATNVSIKMDGAGNAIVYATGNLSVQVSGSGYVEYYGSPKSMTQSVQGAGKIFEVPTHGKGAN